MDVSPLTWWLTIGITTTVLLFDVVVLGRRPHEPSRREVGTALAVYVGLAVVFGTWVWLDYGHEYGTQFFAGWLAEYSLSIDNLFVFLIIMARFAVPRELQQSALLVGIVLALVMRGGFIAVGAAAIESFSWIFYVFGLFLVYTAVKLARQGSTEDDTYEGNGVTRFMTAKGLPPMVVVIVALGTTDLLFALDSIPAIYGLTEEPFLVLTANIFALMGLRQLYFLIGDLLKRLVYLSYGLAFLLGFIGLKLALHAMHENELPFVNGGEHVSWAPDIPIWLSLAVIALTLSVTTVASLARTGRGNREPAPAVVES